MSSDAAQRRASPAALASARASIDRLIAGSRADVAVGWRPLDADEDDEERILVNAAARFHAASTMKAAVMVEVFRRAAAGQLDLDGPVPLTNRFTSLAGGGPYALSPEDDSDAGLYASIGRAVTVRSLCEAMIARSSNLAANTLVELVGARAIQAAVDGLGAPGMHVRRGVEDRKAFDAGLNNTTDAVSLLTLFWKLGRGEVVSAAASAEMRAILERQTFRDGIPAGLPPGIAVAHKTGTITEIHHDAGIVYASRPYALVVLVRGIDDRKASGSLIASITSLVHTLTD